MRHFGNIADNDITLDILAHCKGKLALCLSVFLAVDKLTERNGISMVVWHFYSYARLARHRGFDTNAHCREVKCDIVCKTRYLRHSYACCRLKLISCNGRTSVYAHDPCFSAICFKRFHKLRRFLLYLLLYYLGSHRIFSIFEYIHRRINVSRYFIIFLKERCLTVLINIHYRWLNRLVLGLLFFSAVAYGVFYYLFKLLIIGSLSRFFKLFMCYHRSFHRVDRHIYL